MSITQLNVSYAESQDRLLFRFTTREDQEFRLWLTRKRVLDLLDSIQTHLSVVVAQEHHGKPPAEVKKISAAQQQDVAQKTKLKTFEPGRLLPLGADPLLIFGASVEALPIGKSSDTAKLKISLAHSKELSITCTETLLRQLLVLLKHGVSTANWMPSTHPPETHEPSNSNTLH